MKLNKRNIEHRRLTREEVDILVNECEPTETKFLRDLKVNIFDFFKVYCLVQDGFLVDGRPIYLAGLIQGQDKKIRFWTVVNKNTNSIITMSKFVKKDLAKWVQEFGVLYATMEKINEKNMKWVEWLGFKIFEQNKEYITYRIGV